MTLEDRLTYCKICNNKKFNPEQGIICSLTDEKPDFSPKCKDFSENTTGRSKLEKEINYRYRDYTEVAGWRNDFLKYRYPTNPARIKRLDKKLSTEFKVRVPSNELLILFGFMALILLVSIFSDEIPQPINSYVTGILTILVIVVPIMIYMRWKNGVIYAVLDDSGIKTGRNNVIKWNDILCVMIKSEFKSKETYMTPRYYLSIWRLGSSKDETISLEYFPLYLPWLMTAIEVYRHRNRKLNKP